MRWATLFLLLTTPALAADKPLGPVDAIAMAHADLASLPPASRSTVRYLWLGHRQQSKTRKTDWSILSGHLNELSTEADLNAPVIVDGSNGSLLRIDVTWYGDEKWAATWEKLAAVEPYFHVNVLVEQEEIIEQWYQERDQFGRVIRRYKELERTGRVTQQKVRALAPWLAETPEAARKIKELVEWTQSQVPIVYGDWLVGATAIQFGREGYGYYDWLGIKNRDDYERLVAFDAKLARSARLVELLEAVALSGVSQQPRRIGRFPAYESGYWRTFDIFKDFAVDEKNPLEVPDAGYKHQAEETVTVKANGFILWGLFAADGTRQDSAPDGIGYDHFAAGNDGRIHISLACKSCHYLPAKGGGAGLVDMDAWFRGLHRRGHPLQSPDPVKAKELRQQYARDIEGPMRRDRQRHRDAVREATGLEVDEWAAVYRDMWHEYEEQPVGLERAAAVLGFTTEELRGKIQAYDRAFHDKGLVNPTTAALLVGKRIGIRQFEAEIPRLQLVIRGIPPVPLVSEKVTDAGTRNGRGRWFTVKGMKGKAFAWEPNK